MLNLRMTIGLAVTCTLAMVVSGADEFSEEDAGLPGWYVGTSVGVLMPGGGSSMDGAAAVSLRAGKYLSEYFALELEGWSAPSVDCDHGSDAAVAAARLGGLFHLSGWEAFDKLFGCERLDPFATLGAGMIFADRHVFADGSHRTALGPEFGVGAFYHLTDSLSLRGDGRVMIDCDVPAGAIFSVAVGVQYSFGGGE